MTKIYARRIKAGLMSLEDVPMLWREKVKQMLEQEESV